MGEGIDVEALQAQIDLSNSIAYDLVSSWMKPSSSKDTTESISKSIARELEEHAKRPPRLGLGASVSKSSVATSREAAKLRGKLIGAKRAREDGGDGASTSAAGKVQDDEDEDESRSAAISTKKAKVNGSGGHALGLGKRDRGKGKTFGASESAHKVVTEEDQGGGAKKKQKKEHHEDARAQEGDAPKVNATPSKPNPFVLPTMPLANTSVIDLIVPSPVYSAASADSPTSHKKKKHKKKKRKGVGKDDAAPVEDDEWHGFSNDPLEVRDVPDEEPLGLVHKTPLPTISLRHVFSKTSGPDLSSPPSIIDLTSPARPTPSSSHHPRATVTQATALLNLQGPPLASAMGSNEEEKGADSSSPKRKRQRRRGKGKKGQGRNEGQ